MTTLLLLIGCSTILILGVGAFDVTRTKVEEIQLTSKDIIAADELDVKTRDNARQYRFIGDLKIGERHSDETVFRRTVDVSNPTDDVYSSAIMLSVERGTIHYVSITNERNSYAVACDDLYSLGSSRTSIKVRVPPNSKSTLLLIVAAH
ncbi:hypothetical protein QAD02_010443 [Eretmocerus hayati]|uniref:Uncharacterized protein n=1 Tax=Eretmocerus hayati TaxID=131215 RepID=A0ACC2NU89_9HYME|nr:hypothetical protein QAD02_010443 [Eretmocerus hayati]